MLLEYYVSNFRSIYKEQSFNMIAVNSYKEMRDTNLIKYKENQSLLKSTAIYGPNASGKSTLLESLDTFRDIVLDSFKYDINDKLPITPFAFSENSKNEPTIFNIVFIENEVKYELELLVDKTRILEENLIAYPKGQPQEWYSRFYDEDTQEYEYKYSTLFKGQKKTWEKSTKKNALYLSTAINLQDDENAQLSPIYNWFKNKLTPISIHDWSDKETKELCVDNQSKKLVINFLQQAGIDIKDIEFKIEKKRNIKIKFVHSNGMSLDLSEQSDGTQKLFAFASLWLESLSSGKVLFCDELNDNLHPALVKLLVDMFNSQSNDNNAQLIFTTHETSILNQEVLRRDQVWFCERDSDLSTKIYPLSDFKPRKEYENIENSYLSGRYGAIPYFKKINSKMTLRKES